MSGLIAARLTAGNKGLGRARQISTVLMVFGITMVFVSLSQLTVILAVVNILLFPIALILLAIFFLKGPHTVEVV